MKPQEEKRPEFDRYAGDYAEWIHHPIRNRFAASGEFFFERKIWTIRRFFHKAGIPTEKLDWLDVGCGQGDLLRLGSPFFRSVAGCDPSKEMLRSCEDLRVRHQLSLDSLPFENGSFDFISAVCVYHHVPPERRLLLTEEALRILRPGGILCIIEHNPLNPVTKLIVAQTPVDADGQLMTAGEARRMLSSAGSTVSETRFFLLFPELLHGLTRPIEDALSGLPFGGQYAVFSRARV